MPRCGSWSGTWLAAGAGADEVRGMYGYMTTLTTDSRARRTVPYRPADTDMPRVGERAPETRMAELISTLVWQPIGAELMPRSPATESVRRSTTVGCRRGPSTRRGSARCCSMTGWPRTPRWSQAGWLTASCTIDPGHQGGVCGVGPEPLPHRRVVSQPVLVHARRARRPQGAVPGNSRPDGAEDRATRTVAVKFSSGPPPRIRRTCSTRCGRSSRPVRGRTVRRRPPPRPPAGRSGVVEGRERGHS